MSDFIPGIELSRLFYLEQVKPILRVSFRDLKYSAALIGKGSEILGFDTELSTDHHWGPRVMLFFGEDDYQHNRLAIDEALRNQLPPRFRSYPTNFTLPNPADNNIQYLQDVEGGPINHRVEMYTIRGFLLDYLNLDINGSGEIVDWLTFPEQKLIEITAGAVYHDEIGLQTIRSIFNYYPNDVWLYLLACGWNRIGQEEHLMGRAGMVGDEIGSTIIAARLVRDIMRLCFLMEKQYAPYPKWFGKAFHGLECAQDLSSILKGVVQSEEWQERETYLAEAYEYIAAMHNRLGITEPVASMVSSFFGRPLLVIHGEVFANAIRKQITDPAIKQIADQRLIGSIDQYSDSTDLLSDTKLRIRLRRLYE